MTDLTIVLRGKAADKLRQLIADENYAHPEEAVEDALDALDASRDKDLDAWLRDVVKARADAHANDPSRALSADELRAVLRKT